MSSACTIRTDRPGNGNAPAAVHHDVKRLMCVVGLVASVVWAGSEYTSARQKIDSIQGGHLRPGSRITFTYPELTAYVAHEAPAGVRNSKCSASAIR